MVAPFSRSSMRQAALCGSLVLFIALLPTASATPLRAIRRRPSGSTLLSLRPSALVDKALIDSDRRGADQRQPWVRAVAAVHPVWRTSAALTVTAIVGALIWVQEAVSQGQCTAWQLGTLIVCRALLQLGLLAVAVVALAMLLAVSSRLAALEELKDHGLSNEDLMAAFSCAAYAGKRTRHRANRTLAPTLALALTPAHNPASSPSRSPLTLPRRAREQPARERGAAAAGAAGAQRALPQLAGNPNTTLTLALTLALSLSLSLTLARALDQLAG